MIFLSSGCIVSIIPAAVMIVSMKSIISTVNGQFRFPLKVFGMRVYMLILGGPQWYRPLRI